MTAMNPFAEISWGAREVRSVLRGWWVLLLSGIASIVAGGIILSIDWTLADLAVFIGIFLICRGVFTTWFGVPIDGSARGWSIALGLLETVVGVAVLAWPSPTLYVVAFWIGWYVLFIGIVTIAGAISGRNVLPYWGFLLALGIIEELLAFWLLARPHLTLVVAVLSVGLWSVILGIAQIILAFDIKRLGQSMSRVDQEADTLSRRGPDGQSRERSGPAPVSAP